MKKPHKRLPSSLKYILYLTALHVALGVLAYYHFAGNGVAVLVAEVILLGSAYVAVRIYRALISPLELLGRGAAALEDKDFSVKLMPTGSREMDRIVTVYNNMIDQLRAERISGRQREEFLDRLLTAAELGVIVLDYDGEVSSMNPWMTDRCKDDGFRSAVLEPALHPRQRPQEKAPPDSEGEKGSGSFVLTGPGNRRYHVERASFVDRGFERGFLIVQDVTTDLMTAEKEAYGKVIRMMAHEVNNSNAAIISVLRSLLDAATEGDDRLPELNKDYLPVVIGRAENMTAFMRNFARVVRLPEPETGRTDLNELLRRTGEVMGPILRENDVTLRYELTPGEVNITADAGQLEQVLINALTNARESIGRGGNILISTTAFPAGFVIADDGPGIPKNVAAKVFTPFFSTKPTGQGVGLTLSRDILEAHGATYELATEEDGWTRLRVDFP